LRLRVFWNRRYRQTVSTNGIGFLVSGNPSGIEAAAMTMERKTPQRRRLHNCQEGGVAENGNVGPKNQRRSTHPDSGGQARQRFHATRQTHLTHQPVILSCIACPADIID
jgi:hypothetical protein